MTHPRTAVLHRLSSGEALLVESLARELGESVESLHGHLAAFRTRGLEVEWLAGDRVRLQSPFDALDRDAIVAWLGACSRRALEDLEVLFEVGSTNQFLLDLARHAQPTAPRACLAEVQSAGRGRGGRPFFSTLGGSIVLSVLWPVRTSPAGLLGLSPAIAVAVARALESDGVDGIGLKWPNDVLVGKKKACGILLEVGQRGREGCFLVVGIGINVRMAASTGLAIDQPWTDLYRTLGRMPARNRIAGRVIDQVMETAQVYFEQGFEPFRAAYRDRDVLEGNAVRLIQPESELAGICRGLDENGALLVESSGGIAAHLFGDVSVRLRS